MGGYHPPGILFAKILGRNQLSIFDEEFLEKLKLNSTDLFVTFPGFDPTGNLFLNFLRVKSRMIRQSRLMFRSVSVCGDYA